MIHAVTTSYAIGGGVMVCVMVLLMRRGQGRTGNNIAALALISLNWHIVALFACLCKDPLRAAYLRDMTLPFMAFFLVALLLYSLRFFGRDRYHTPVSILMLSVVPAFTYAVAATSSRHELLWIERRVTGVWPDFARGTPGVWLSIHAGYCVIVAAVTLTAAIARYHRVPRVCRASALRMMGGILLAGAGSVLSLSGLLPGWWDPGLTGGAVCVVLCFLSGRDAREMESLTQIRGDVFHEIDKYVFILDDEGCLVTLNGAAAVHLSGRGIIAATGSSYRALVERAFGDSARREGGEREDGGVDYVLWDNGEERIYNLREKDVPDRLGRRLGVIAIWSEVTENRAVIRKLEETAGLDAITGLLNRNKMERMLPELDLPENLPIAVLVGDLNNLKAINDSFGHQQGDMLLRTAAEGLRFCCPPKAVIARTGGDEFLAVIPSCTRNQVQALIRNIDAYFASPPSGHHNVAMALGAGVKLTGDQPIAEIIAQADALMYADKHQKKFSGGK